MITAIVLLLSPIALNGATQAAKVLTGIQSKGGQRILLALMSLAGVIGVSAATGNPIDPDSVTSIVQTIVEAFVAFLSGHASYHLFFKGERTA